VEAATQVVIEREPVLLVCYDVVPPAPLHATRPIAEPFGVAIVLTASGSGVALRIERSTEQATHFDDAALEPMRLANPAARSLPLLRLLARGEAGRVMLPGAGNQRWIVQVG